MENISVVYHYIRDNQRMHALTPKQFESQISFFSRDYKLITLTELLNKDNSEKTCTITFDDGLKDSYNVIPVLNKFSAKAVFFLPCSILSGSKKVLAVQKRHYLLAEIGVEKFTEEFNKISDESHKIKPDKRIQELWNKNRALSIYDDVLTANLKYTLDYGTPDKIESFLGKVFNKFFDEEKEFDKMYMNKKEIKLLEKQGMDMGIHGLNHKWLGKLTPKEQFAELSKSVELFDDFFGYKPKYISYPHGDYNLSTLRILKELGFKAGYTIKEHDNTNLDNPLELGRYDCARYLKEK
ncbi:MAG: polysaccharide deacetylase family protein [archaeon]